MPSLLNSKCSTTTRDHRVAVALQILHEQFGEITRDVAQVLMNIEYCTLQQLTRNVALTFQGDKKITTKQVKHALLILWKHNCLIIECGPEVDLSEITVDANGLETKLKMTGLLYRLNFDNILNRLRFGQILLYIQEKHGELGVMIGEEIIFHGRLRYATILEEVLKKWKAEKNQGANDSYMTEDIDEEEEVANMKFQIKSIFEKLVQNRFLIIVPPLDIKKRYVASFESKSSKRIPNLLDEISGKGTGNINANAGLVAKSAGKRGRSQLTTTSADAKGSKDELLPVELRLMMNSGAEIKVKEDEEEEWEPSNKKSRIAPSSSSNAPVGGRGGRGGGRATGRGGRGRGRGAGVREEDENTFPDQSKNGSSSTTANGFGESIIRGEVYWMIGYDQFIREERHMACINIVSDQLENIAGEIVRIILQQSMNTELGPNPSKSTALSLEEIFTKIKEYSHQQQQNQPQNSTSQAAKDEAAVNQNILASLDLNTLKKLLDVMRLSSMGAIMRIPGSEAEPNGPLFLVNYESIIASLRRRTILQIAQGRFGVASGRIIELLQRNKYLEQQTVSDRAILPARETRERLYRLYRDRWVNYVEFSKRGDFNPSSNYYFWYLDLPRLKSSLLQHLYKAIFNLRLRKEKEIVNGKEILDFAIISESDQKRFNSLMQKINLLDFSIQRIDSMILLMEKF